jgi:23S rRNA (uracil1939-C5)-methyltransferase
MTEKNISIKKGAEIEVEIESLAFGGMGVSRLNDKITFVKNAIPGQKVRARITKKKKSYLEARKLVVIDESPNSVPARCEHFNDCGGCTFQNLDYAHQLSEKENQIKELFYRIGKFKNINIASIQECNNQFHYRNKMEFTFSNMEYIPEIEKLREASDFVLGLHAPGRWDKILDINECHIQSVIANQILEIIKKNTFTIPPYNIRNHKGFLRNVIIRVSENTNDIMVNLVTSKENIDLLNHVKSVLIKKVPQISCIVNNITSRKSGVSSGEKQILLHGNDYIIEKLGDYKFKVSADSFFQTNTKQAEKLYKIILEEASLTGKEIVYDMFCGTGSIALYLSKYVKYVYGFEIVTTAVEDARENASLNHVKNAFFFEGNLENIFRNNQDMNIVNTPDVIVVDPPRAGLHVNTIADILDRTPKKIIYVSCNPSTQARDVEILCKDFYDLINLRPVDMFPHTPHVENVATIIRK